eukprot:377044-Amphidinium_carterae.2
MPAGDNCKPLKSQGTKDIVIGTKGGPKQMRVKVCSSEETATCCQRHVSERTRCSLLGLWPKHTPDSPKATQAWAGCKAEGGKDKELAFEVEDLRETAPRRTAMRSWTT